MHRQILFRDIQYAGHGHVVKGVGLHVGVLTDKLLQFVGCNRPASRSPRSRAEHTSAYRAKVHMREGHPRMVRTGHDVRPVVKNQPKDGFHCFY